MVVLLARERKRSGVFLWKAVTVSAMETNFEDDGCGASLPGFSDR
jgi:hypothetical protein